MELILISLLSLFNIQVSDFKLQNGDLIFQESCSDGVGNAIKEVTSSIDEYRFTHVGIVYIDEKDRVFVIEATHPKVAMTPLHDYLFPKDKPCYPISVVGRLKEEYHHLIPAALEDGLKLVGKEYDYGYILDNDKYYCSELIYDILLKANNGVAVFPLNVMTFKSAETDDFSERWIKYFEKLGMDIPEGELGINPGAMSRSDVIDIIYSY